MRFPVDNYETDWNGTAGYGFGEAVAYGFHDGVDINDNFGGNSDLGKPLFAIANGKVVGVHKHTGTGNFGNHFFLMVEGDWGVRYVHYAHCLELFVTEGQLVPEGFKVATVGNSGTVYAHCHFAVKKKPSGMDDVANNKAELDDIWEDPIAFVKKYLPKTTPTSSSDDADHKRAYQVLEDYRKVRLDGKEGSFEGYVRALVDRDKDYSSLAGRVTVAESQIQDLTTINRQQAEMVESLQQSLKECQERLENPPFSVTTTTSPPSLQTVVAEPVFGTKLGQLFYSIAKSFG